MDSPNLIRAGPSRISPRFEMLSCQARGLRRTLFDDKFGGACEVFPDCGFFSKSLQSKSQPRTNLSAVVFDSDAPATHSEAIRSVRPRLDG